MKRGVEVAVRVEVAVVVGQAVTWNRGVEVAVRVVVGVVVEVAVRVVVVDDVTVELVVAVSVEVVVPVVVGEDVGGRAVGETEEASLPTVRSTPHTWGSDRVAE
jgi:hypothetical protein